MLRIHRANSARCLFFVQGNRFAATLDQLAAAALRWGCGKCPTILFGTSYEDEIKKNQPLLIDYVGTGMNGKPVGVGLFGNDTMPTELVFWSLDGLEDVEGIPALETLKPLDGE